MEGGEGKGNSVKRFQRRDVYAINVCQLKLFTFVREARRKCNLNINFRKQRKSAEKISHRKQTEAKSLPKKYQGNYQGKLIRAFFGLKIVKN